MNRPRTLTALAQEYLDYRRKLGFRLHVEGRMVLAFAEHADKIKHKGAITTELALRWARLPQNVSALYHAKRLEAVRGFAKYAAIFDEATEIPSRWLLGIAHRRNQPHIYDDAEIGLLMKAARQLPPRNGLRPRTYMALFGVLASTGLRISEALRLRQADVDLRQGLLRILETKFHKSRLVVLHPTTRLQLQAYERFRDRYRRRQDAAAFFLSESGKALNYSTVRTTFRKMSRRLGLDTTTGRPRPRLYDFRHTFACRRLLQCYRQGVDVDHAIASLSAYMGHGKVTDTYWYLTGIPELLRIAAAKFDRLDQTRFLDTIS